jgi:hypothetical protein
VVVVDALDAISSWKDTSSKFSVRLDATFLARLANDGYVPNEAVARAQLRQAQRRRRVTGTRPLFASRRFVPPTRVAAQTRPATPPPAQATSPGTVLLMRLRKASLTARQTQTQIPFRVMNTFFRNATQVRSAHSPRAHGIIQASARGGPNTTKLEIPEMRNFQEPVARFERRPNGIVYEVYDVGSPQGNQIIASLKQGMSDGTTQLSIRNAQRATWWRFI